MKTKKEFLEYCDKLNIPRQDIDYSGKTKTFYIYNKHPGAFAFLVMPLEKFKVVLVESVLNQNK